MKSEMEKIVAACQRKETWAQKALYEAFASQMLGVCMRYTHSRDEAQDLLHDGFIKVFDKIGKLENPQSVAPWMYKIMVRVSINYVTRNNELVYHDFEGNETAGSEDVATEPHLDTDQYHISDVMEAMHQLPANYWLMFNMREVEEMEYAEIADILGLNESTIRSGVFRARQQLRKILSK